MFLGVCWPGLSCTCEANYLCDDLTVALRGRLCPRADKSPGGGKLYFFIFYGGGRFIWAAPIKSWLAEFDDYLELFVLSSPAVKVRLPSKRRQ